jgi:predicted acylesterase/phospholipase RssA
MFPSVLLAALGGTLLIADGLPALNVESGCRAAAKMGGSLSLDTSLRQCLADEKSARDELEKQWTQFSLVLRERCVATTETAGNPSYVEVLVCLQMGRDAALTAKRESSPVDVAERSTTSPRDISREFIKPLLKSHRDLPRPPFDCVALVLQGGGALGAFQAGVYQALAEANLQPDWVAGISIGAINCALIAGNAPEARLEKLRAFWEQVSTQLVFDPFGIAHYWLRGDMGHVVLNRLRAGATLLEGAPGFFKPRFPPPYLAPPGTVEATSWYDTTPLRSTLERLVDFDRINFGEMRFSVGAVNIRSGNFVYFDSTTHKIRPEHIMASGALLPGCPAVEVDGELYWDGGLVSNTPLQWVVRFPSRPVERARRLAERSQRRVVATERDPVFEQDAGPTPITSNRSNASAWPSRIFWKRFQPKSSNRTKANCFGAPRTATSIRSCT